MSLILSKMLRWNIISQDIEDKQHELDDLKAHRAKDLHRLKLLTVKYLETEQVISTPLSNSL